MHTDRDLQEDVLEALEWEPELDVAQIGVSVTDGVVTLRGPVATAHQKWTAERATRHLIGVRAVANDLEVSPAGPASRSDSAIAEAVADALEWDSAVPDHAIKATVRNGWVTLTGSATQPFEKSAAERAAGRLPGVKGVANSIVVKPSVNPQEVKAKIEEGFKRSARIDAQRISVDAEEGAVVLTGTVRSLAERDDAERAAWAVPGVVKVVDRLVVV
jgi:osmotically-inducible protein OsmY